MTRRPLRLHVCIDQELSDEAQSGLVRGWARFIQEANRHSELEVTAHLIGARDRTRTFSSNVRVREHPLVLGSTALLSRIGMATPAHVGLFPYHPTLARELRNADVIHTAYTHLSLAMTALIVARRQQLPIVNSLHTHVPIQSEIYAQRFAELAFSKTPLSRPMVARRHFATAVRRAFDAQLRWYLGYCNHVLASVPNPEGSLPDGYPAERTHYLGRGIDSELFSPSRRDRAWLHRTFGIPERQRVVLFVGKLMAEKNVLTLADALALLNERGQSFTAVFCGEGDQRSAVAARIGRNAVFTGVVSHRKLARIYAGSDLFAFPSATEMYANVVVEAMSSGLPVLVSGSEGACQHVSRPGENGGVVTSDEPANWARAIDSLLDDPVRRRRMGLAGRESVLKHYTDWRTIFDGTLLPIWLAAAEEGARPGPRHFLRKPLNGSSVPAAGRLGGISAGARRKG